MRNAERDCRLKAANRERRLQAAAGLLSSAFFILPFLLHSLLSLPRGAATASSTGLHQALHHLSARNEWGEDRGEGKPIKTHLLSPALSSIRWRRGRNRGA